MKATAMTALDAIRARLRGKRDVPVNDLAEALIAATGARNTAAAEVTTTRAAVDAATFESDATRSKLRADAVAAAERLADAEALVDAIGHQHDDAVFAAAEADRMVRAMEAHADATRAADTFARDYHKATSLLLDCMERMFLAQAAVDAANRNLPYGVEPIADVEYLSRATPGESDETIESSTIWLWCRAEGEAILPETMQDRIEDLGGNRGQFRHAGGLLKCVRLPFNRRVVRRGTMGVVPDAMLPTLTLPHFRRPGEYLLHPSMSMSTSSLAAVQTAKARLTAAPELASRRTETVITAVDHGDFLVAQAETELAPAELVETALELEDFENA